jgi:PKD repeat protein
MELRFVLRALGSIFALTVFISGCTSTSDSSTQLQKVTSLSVMKASSVVDGISLSAPQFAMISIPISVSLNVPAGVTVLSAQWDFGDGITDSGTGPLDHTYFDVGTATVSVSLTDSLGTQMTLTQDINVLAYNERFTCVSGIRVSLPDYGTAGQPVNGSVTIPDCLTSSVSDVGWNFGDGSAAVAGLNVQHIYGSAGTYTVTASVNAVSTIFSISTSLDIAAGEISPGPGPSPAPAPSPSPSPSPAPAPSPSPSPSPAPAPSPSPSPSPAPAPSPSPSPSPAPAPSPSPAPAPAPSPAACTDASSVGNVVILDPHAKGALTLSGNASLQTSGQVLVNSDNAAAVTLNGNARISASQVSVAAGAADPFGLIGAPDANGMNAYGYTKISGAGSMALSPGVYNGAVSISGHGSVTFKPGVYILKGGLQVSGGVSVSGDGVLLYIEGGSLALSGGSSVHLSAMQSGCLAGMTIFQARGNANSMNLSGGSELSLGGAVYAPNASVDLSGRTNPSQITAAVVNQLKMSGGSTLVSP